MSIKTEDKTHQAQAGIFKIKNNFARLDLGYQSKKENGHNTIYITGGTPQIRAEVEIRLRHLKFSPISITDGVRMIFKVPNTKVFRSAFKTAKAGFALDC